MGLPDPLRRPRFGAEAVYTDIGKLAVPDHTG